MGTALSHSRLSTYNQCPKKFQLQFLEKTFPEETKSHHLIRGDNVHKALENYVIKKLAGEKYTPAMLPEVDNTIPLIDRFFTQYDEIHPESQVSVNNQFSKVDWFSSDSYYRAIIDLLALRKNDGLAIDWKTGKVRDYDSDGYGQLHLTSAIILSIYPNIEQLSTAYVFVDHKKTDKIIVRRDELPVLLKHFHSEYDKVNSDKEFKPKTNEFCKWCPATKQQCPYSRKL